MSREFPVLGNGKQGEFMGGVKSSVSAQSGGCLWPTPPNGRVLETLRQNNITMDSLLIVPTKISSWLMKSNFRRNPKTPEVFLNHRESRYVPPSGLKREKKKKKARNQQKESDASLEMVTQCIV